MKKNNIFLLLMPICAAIAFFAACNDKAPDYPVEPRIEFVSMSKNTFNADIKPDSVSGQPDSILVTFSFQDGDGDLGDDDKDSYTVAIINPQIPINGDDNPTPYNIEPFPQNGVGKSITGEMTVKIKGLCCSKGCKEIMPVPSESVAYRLYIKDRAGHKSNELILPIITIPCLQ